MIADMTPFRRSLINSLIVAAFALGCGPDSTHDEGPAFAPESWPLDRLSSYGFFVGPLANMQPATGVVPYQVAAPLWADHAGKARFIVLPPGRRVDVDGDGGWRFPDGTVIIKNFYFTTDRRRPDESAALVETRLLIKSTEEWVGHTYVWNTDHSDADKVVAGRRLDLEFIGEDGRTAHQEYVVPNTNQCKDCHEIDDVNGLLGLIPRQLDRMIQRGTEPMSQLDWLHGRNIFDTEASPTAKNALVDPFGDAPLEQRARAYLDANCSHCHRAGGNGGPSGLVLLASETEATKLGVCKAPIAAGPGSGDRLYDIVPGRPDDSILVLRMESTNPEVKMPEIPNRFPHDSGVELIRAWISNMPEQDCGTGS